MNFKANYVQSIKFYLVLEQNCGQTAGCQQNKSSTLADMFSDTNALLTTLLYGNSGSQYLCVSFSLIHAYARNRVNRVKNCWQHVYHY